MMTPRLPTWLMTAGSLMVREISPSEAAANLRLRWAGLGIHLPLLAVVFLSWGFAPYFYAWAATLLLYLLGNHGLSVAIRRGNSPQVFASLLIALDFFLISALLAIAGRLEGPFIVFYGVVGLVGATLWSAAAAASASVLGFVSYAAALAFTQSRFMPETGVVLFESLEPTGIVGPLSVTAATLICACYMALVNMIFLRRRMAAAESRYKAVFNAVRVPIFVFDAETKQCLDANDAALAGAGVSRDQLQALDAFVFSSPESTDRVVEWVLGSPMRMPKAAVHHIVLKDGKDLYLEIAVGRGEFNKREAYVVSFKNRTAIMKLQQEREKYAERLEAEVSRRTRDLEGANQQLRELQTRLMEAQRLATAGEMAGEIAHAIFNPLTVLIGTVQMRIEASRQVDPHDQTILRLAQRVAAIVERMLLMSRRGWMQPEDVPPACLVADLREELTERCRSNGVEVIEWLEPDLPDARVDRALLTMALVQIAENAVDAMASGGKLSLSVERVPGAEAFRFRIRDTGSGIPPHLRARVLEPFFSTKPHGTGLGLTIARGVVQGHEGNIRFESQEDVGTEVIVEIPRCGLRESLGAAQPRQ